jgi:hypothetical protein
MWAAIVYTLRSLFEAGDCEGILKSPLEDRNIYLWPNFMIKSKKCKNRKKICIFFLVMFLDKLFCNFFNFLNFLYSFSTFSNFKDKCSQNSSVYRKNVFFSSVLELLNVAWMGQHYQVVKITALYTPIFNKARRFRERLPPSVCCSCR